MNYGRLKLWLWLWANIDHDDDDDRDNENNNNVDNDSEYNNDDDDDDNEDDDQYVKYRDIVTTWYVFLKVLSWNYVNLMEWNDFVILNIWISWGLSFSFFPKCNR